MVRSRLAFVFILSLILASTVPTRAATPTAGTIDSGSPTAAWVGQFYAVAATAVPEACPPVDPTNAVCDHFFLTVNVTPTYWDTNTGGAEISITWADSNNDFDLYVYDSNGTQVAFSASGGTTSEIAFVQNASGTYEVRVVPFLVVASNYNGTARFVSQPGGPTPNPIRGTGGLVFGPATVIDAQRTEGEPVNHIDKGGNYWESGPYGTTTQQSFIHRSIDSGDQFNVVSAVGLRPDPPPGGGDTDVTTDDQGNAYFVDLEALVNLGCAVSHDNGNTWPKNDICVASTGVDRQWFAMDNGTTAGAADNTIFLAFREAALGSSIYSSPGSTGVADLVGGLVYTDSSAALSSVQDGAPCGQLRFDPVNRNLYYACSAGDHVQITRGHVNVGQRTGINYTNVQAPLSPGGAVGDIFPAVATDSAGNVYAVWIDETNHNVYYAASTNQGTTWGPVRQINGNDANSNVFPWAVAGSAGNLVVAWYGNASHLDSDNMPSWYNNRQAATAFPWFGYVSLISGAASTSPSFVQQRFTEKPMHYGQICNGGIGCTVSGGDRTMADFFAVALDLDGSMRFVYNDTTSQHHGAHIFEVRQLKGPTATGRNINKPAPGNPMSDPSGDAQSPHYAPGGPGASLTRFDFTQLRLSQPNANTLRIQMTLNNLNSFMPPTGKANALWLTRFQARSLGDEGEESYRIFYAGAESVGGATPTFFAGSGDSNNNGVPGDGCVNTTAENCKIVQYPNELAATGSISGNVITIDVALNGGFGAGRPILATTLYNVTALSAGRDNATVDVYADLDATRAFDFTLGQVTVPGIGRKVTGGGAIPSGTGEAKFALNVLDSLKGKIDVRDAGAQLDFRSTTIRSVRFDDPTHSVTIKGAGIASGQTVDFTVVAIDNGEAGTTDSFTVSLSNGYSRGGTLTRGNIQIH
jgi:hypothetical protein